MTSNELVQQMAHSFPFHAVACQMLCFSAILSIQQSSQL